MINWKRNRPSVEHLNKADTAMAPGASALDEDTPVDRPRPSHSRQRATASSVVAAPAPASADVGFAYADTVPNLIPQISEDPSTLGNILLNLGVLTEDELFAALARHQVLGEGLLGALVCEQGSCTTRDVARAMDIQARLREGRAAEASLGYLASATEEMSNMAKKLSDTIKGARVKARRHGAKTGLFLVPANMRDRLK